SSSSSGSSSSRSSGVGTEFCQARGVLAVIGSTTVGASSLQAAAIAAEALRTGFACCLVHLSAHGDVPFLLQQYFEQQQLQQQQQLQHQNQEQSQLEEEQLERLVLLSGSGCLIGKAEDEVRAALSVIKEAGPALPLVVVALGDAFAPVAKALTRSHLEASAAASANAAGASIGA
ncbi:uncharacterized protein LOC113146496, partial [Cyclospora cayetanensis]|uniref:Uncharacterized protein LOC113146496 n=1 Tax=Cyclospora cayetanensis TaxID=88456 RepID=A0A6P6RRR4_9EIME